MRSPGVNLSQAGRRSTTVPDHHSSLGLPITFQVTVMEDGIERMVNGFEDGYEASREIRSRERAARAWRSFR
jgi:hypothetical protein